MDMANMTATLLTAHDKQSHAVTEDAVGMLSSLAHQTNKQTITLTCPALVALAAKHRAK